jgi:hypothetical protein
MALAVRVGGGQGPEAIELSVERTTEVEGIEALIERSRSTRVAGERMPEAPRRW